MARKRPTRKTINKTKVIDEITLDICQWLGEGEDKSGVKESVTDIIENNTFYDAYDMAKELEYHGFYPDAQLVEILDKIEYKIYLQLNQEVEEWVSKRKLKPKFGHGDKVKAIRSGVEYEGEIIEVNNKVAKYLVCCEEAGHVKKGIGTHGFLITWEEIEEINK